VYIINKDSEQYKRIEQAFSVGNLYACKRDVDCNGGAFTEGTLVHIGLQGYSDGWKSLRDLGAYTVSDLVKKSSKLRVVVNEIDEDTIGSVYFYPESEVKDYINLETVDLDALENIVGNSFERQTALEEELDEADQYDNAYEKGDAYFDKSLIALVVMALATLTSLICTNSSKNGNESIGGFAVFAGIISVLSLISFFALNIYGGHIVDVSEKRKDDFIKYVYLKWKMDRS
jgi:hypothetical protein